MIRLRYIGAVCTLVYLTFLYHLILPVQFGNANAAVEYTVQDVPTITPKSIKKSVKKVKKNKVPEHKAFNAKLVDYVLDNSDECSEEQAEIIVDEVQNHKDPLLLLSIIKVESRFDRKAVSSERAIGLGQIMPLHVKALKKKNIVSSKEDLKRIRPNIKAMNHVLGTYNGNLARYGNSRSYAVKVNREYAKLKSIVSNSRS